MATRTDLGENLDLFSKSLHPNEANNVAFIYKNSFVEIGSVFLEM